MVKFILRTLRALDFRERLSISIFILLYFAFFTWLSYSLQHVSVIFIYTFKILQIVNVLAGTVLGFWTFEKFMLKGKETKK